jgi:predicted nuclease with TOPRIM domain
VLPAQVKSMQEEIGRLQRENGQLKKSEEQLQQGNGQLAGLQEVVTLLKKENSDMKTARKTVEDELATIKAENDELRKAQVISFVCTGNMFTAMIESWAVEIDERLHGIW